MQSISVNTSSINDTLDGIDTVVLIDEKISIDQRVGKFILPSVTPTMAKDSAVQSSVPKKSTQNIINRENLGATSITSSNYIELTIPKHLFTIKDIQVQSTITPNAKTGGDGYYVSCNPKTTNNVVINYNEFTKGQEFIVAYVSDENIQIIGVIE